ncbi:MAG: hypothetical protein ACYDCW_07860 [Acidithiobacillus ferrivorans]
MIYRQEVPGHSELSSLIGSIDFSNRADLHIANEISRLAGDILPRDRAERVLQDLESLRALHAREVSHA